MKQVHTESSPARYNPQRVAGDGFGKVVCRLFTLLTCLTATVTALAADRPVVREVLISKEGNGARIEIRANQPLAHRSYLMPELDKWVVDLPGAKTTYSGDESKKLRTTPLERITVRQKEVNGDLFIRIGLDFKGKVNFSLKEDQFDKGHLIILITPLTAASKTDLTDQFLRP